MDYNHNKIGMNGLLHKEGYHLWVEESHCIHGQDINTLVSSIKTGVNSHQLLKIIGMIRNRGHSQQYSQQSAATQNWHVQQQQQIQQQMPALPNPVYPPGMQPNVRPPPGLASNVQRTRQGVMTQGASMQYGSAASRQQSPAGSQPPQDRQQSSYGQQYPSTGGYFRQGYQ